MFGLGPMIFTPAATGPPVSLGQFNNGLQYKFTSVGMASFPAPVVANYYVGRATGAPYFDGDTARRWREMIVYSMDVVSAGSGIQQGATPTSVIMHLRYYEQVMDSDFRFTVAIQGIRGDITTPSINAAIFSELTAAVSPTTVSMVNSSNPAVGTNFDFDITNVVTEIVSDPSWTPDSRIWLAAVITAHTGSTMGGGDRSAGRFGFLDAAVPITFVA